MLFFVILLLSQAFAQTLSVARSQKISNSNGNANLTLLGDDYFGSAVSWIPDLNNDYISDMVVGAYRDDDGSANSGAVYIIFLNQNGTAKGSQKISSTQGNFTPTSPSFFGTSVASLGFFNADSYPDIVVGAFADDDGASNSGAVYILFLNLGGTVANSYKISNLQGNLGSILNADDAFGFSVCNIGDFNNDSVTDIAVGAPNDDDGNSLAGAVYILFLNPNATVKTYQKISSNNGNLSIALNQADVFGSSIALLGDLNQDSNPDLVVGAWGDDDGISSGGAVYILFMNTDGTVQGSQKISNTQGGLGNILSSFSGFGLSISTIGDLNKDSTPDILVGAPNDDDGNFNSGAFYILFLNTDGTVKNMIKYSSTQGNLNITLNDSDNFGSSISVLDDPNQDSIPDIVVGAYQDGDGGVAAGAVYVILYQICGDAIVTGTETCDDNNTVSGDGCDSNCKVESGYTCINQPSICSLCGDGIIGISETCDDSNTVSGDGCGSNCQVESGWECTGEPSICSETSQSGMASSIFVSLPLLLFFFFFLL